MPTTDALRAEIAKSNSSNKSSIKRTTKIVNSWYTGKDFDRFWKTIPATYPGPLYLPMSMDRVYTGIYVWKLFSTISFIDINVPTWGMYSIKEDKYVGTLVLQDKPLVDFFPGNPQVVATPDGCWCMYFGPLDLDMAIALENFSAKLKIKLPNSCSFLQQLD